MRNVIVMGAGLVFLSLAGCNNPTAAGSVLLTQKFSASQGGAPLGSPEAPARRVVSKIRVAGGKAEVEVRLDVVEIPQGRFLSALEVAVTDNGGGELTASIPAGSSPVNRGTPEAVLASQNVMVEWRKNSFGGSTMSQSVFEVRGDGTATDDAQKASAESRPAAEYPVMAPLEEYLIADRDAEVALARTAAPPAISSEATVLVLTRQGYQTAVEGKSGFVCFVDRSWSGPFDDAEYWNPKKRGPTCMNAPAARSAMPVIRRLTELALDGQTKDAILARMKESIAKKEFGPPEIGSMSYMMSKSQYLNDSSPHWHPHLMFYMPGEMNPSVWGANLPAGSAVFGGGTELPGGGRMPWTIFFVPVPSWSDGTLAEAHHD